MEKLTKGRNYSIAGWQAEQYVAFTRCILIVYGAVRDVVGDHEIGINEYECMIQALLCFVSRLMCDDTINSNTLLDHIKCFLSACDMFENKAYIMNGDDAMWYSRGNFLSLLNLPSQVEQFGKIRLYWEGSRERSIQQIKPYLISVRQSSSYFKTKLTHMYVSQTLNTINSSLTSKFPDDTAGFTDEQYQRYASFKIYSASEDIEQIVSFGKVLSLVYLAIDDGDCKFYVCQRSQKPKSCLLYEIQFNDDKGFNKCGIWYAPIDIFVVNVGNELSADAIDNRSEVYGLLCPCISSNVHFKYSYCVICSNWKYRDKHNVLSLPEVSINLFRSSIDNI